MESANDWHKTELTVVSIYNSFPYSQASSRIQRTIHSSRQANSRPTERIRAGIWRTTRHQGCMDKFNHTITSNRTRTKLASLSIGGSVRRAYCQRGNLQHKRQAASLQASMLPARSAESASGDASTQDHPMPKQRSSSERSHPQRIRHAHSTWTTYRNPPRRIT